MTKILAIGCSMTRGHGLKLESRDPELWVNQICNRMFKNSEVANLSESGRNNHWIYTEALHQIIHNNFDIAIVGWSEISRLNFHIGLELYSTCTKLRDPNNNTLLDINVNPGIVYKSKYLNNIGETLGVLLNDHWFTLDLIKYVNSLLFIAKQTNTKIFFVNTLGPWNPGYFDHKDITLPSDLDLYEQSLLNVDTRSDLEIKALYDMMHEHYNTYGGIQENHWLNLYNSISSIQIDYVSGQDRHPGYLSQRVISDFLTNELSKKIV